MELLGSYTFKGTHNFLFPRAEYNLGQLLSSERRPSHLQSESDFLIALSGLISAIQNLHDYFSDALELKFIGCHHDLKPANILVEQGKFLLGDFGLSSLKRGSKGSKSPFAGGEGWYMAPECEDSENEFPQARSEERAICGHLDVSSPI